ncbi:hypothetical protein R6Q57_006791 [Mikania cordata]
MGQIVCSISTLGLTVHGHHDHHEMVKKEYEKMNTCSSFQMPLHYPRYKKEDYEKMNTCSSFQMPLHYPRYKKEDYEKMPEWTLDCLLKEYGLPIDVGDVNQKRKFAMGAFIWA